MEKERLQEYAARVTQANRSELVVIIYEATLASIEEGLKTGELKRCAMNERAHDYGVDEVDLQYEFQSSQLYVFAYGTLSGHRKQRPEQLT
ncbi:MAG: hypothetical protein ACLSD6_04705 [Clostridium sp.]